jgi:hypothetical protein
MKRRFLTSAAAVALAAFIALPGADAEKASALTDTFHQFEDYMIKGFSNDEAQRFSQMFSTPQAAQRALACVLAARQRLRKSEDTMTKEELQAARAANLKSLNAVAICKALVEDQRVYSITEAELVDLIGNHDRQPGETAANTKTRRP